MQEKIVTKKALEQTYEELKKQNESMISGLKIIENRISKLYSRLLEITEQKEKLSKQNTKLLALFIPILIAHIITMTIEPSYRSTPMCYIVKIVSTAYSIDYTVRKIKEYMED